jgi:uncharacterized protein (UPF0333 family)
MAEPYTTFLVVSFSLLAFGIAAGYLINRNSEAFTRSNLRIAVGILVTIVWVATIAAEIIIPAYTVSVLIHGIMGAVVGYLFSDDGLDINIGGA